MPVARKKTAEAAANTPSEKKVDILHLIVYNFILLKISEEPKCKTEPNLLILWNCHQWARRHSRRWWGYSLLLSPWYSQDLYDQTINEKQSKWYEVSCCSLWLLLILLSVLVNNLRVHIKPMYQLYWILKNQEESLTPDEITIASGKKELDGCAEVKYLKKLEKSSENIKKAFEDQKSRAAISELLFEGVWWPYL